MSDPLPKEDPEGWPDPNSPSSYRWHMEGPGLAFTVCEITDLDLDDERIAKEMKFQDKKRSMHKKRGFSLGFGS